MSDAARGSVVPLIFSFTTWTQESRLSQAPAATWSATTPDGITTHMQKRSHAKAAIVSAAALLTRTLRN
jgi:hypothetical protein